MSLRRLGEDLVDELGVRDATISILVVTIDQPGDLLGSGVEAVLSQNLSEFITGQVTISVGVDGREGIMAVELGASAKSLPAKLGTLFHRKMNSEGSLNQISRFSHEEVATIHAFVKVICTSRCEDGCVIR